MVGKERLTINLKLDDEQVRKIIRDEAEAMKERVDKRFREAAADNHEQDGKEVIDNNDGTRTTFEPGIGSKTPSNYYEAIWQLHGKECADAFKVLVDRQNWILDRIEYEQRTLKSSMKHETGPLFTISNELFQLVTEALNPARRIGANPL